MKYKIEFKPKALKDCRKIPKLQLTHIFNQIEMMSDGLKGNVKRLTKFTPEYRLRVGDYRILFETEYILLCIAEFYHSPVTLSKDKYFQE